MGEVGLVWNSLNARELSILTWAFIFLFFILKGNESRKSFVDVLSALFVWKIQFSLFISAAYVAILAYALQRFGIWNLSDLKTTVIWFFSFAIYQMTLLTKVQEIESHFFSVLKGVLSITILTSLILNFRVFPFWIELFIIPSVVMFSFAWALANQKTEYKAISSFLERVFLFSAVGYMAYELYCLITDWRSFFQFGTLKDGLLEILLSVAYIPALYLWFLFFTYEEMYLSLNLAVVEKKLQSKAKWLLFWNFLGEREYLKRWRYYAILVQPKNLKEVKASISHIKRVRYLDKHPQLTHPYGGWSPFLSSQFLKSFGIFSTDYRWTDDETWFAGSNQVRIGSGILTNSIDYWLEGEETVVKKIILYTNINSENGRAETLELFQNCLTKLVTSTIGLEYLSSLPPFLKNYQLLLSDCRLELVRDDWKSKLENGFSLKFTISKADWNS